MKISPLVFLSLIVVLSLSSCSPSYYDVYFSQSIDSIQKFRLVIDGEYYGYIPYSKEIKECSDTTQLGHAKLLEGNYKVQLRNSNDEIIVQQNLRVADRGVNVSGVIMNSEVKPTDRCAITHFFKQK